MKPVVDVVIPVLNEAHVLEASMNTLRRWLELVFPYRWRIVIVDNGSTDGTPHVAEAIASRFPSISLLTLPQKGRGRALRHAWLQSTADAVCYMDVDLSTDLYFLTPLVQAILEDGYDVATGSRLHPESETTRSLRREVTSVVYNWIVKAALDTHFTDAQCGFKALSRSAVERIVPQVEDQSWFFDTELLTLAEKQGLRIYDLPVIWTEDDDSRVKILRTAWDDLKGIWRVRRQLATRETRAVAAAQGRRS